MLMNARGRRLGGRRTHGITHNASISCLAVALLASVVEGGTHHRALRAHSPSLLSSRLKGGGGGGGEGLGGSAGGGAAAATATAPEGRRNLLVAFTGSVASIKVVTQHLTSPC